MVNTVGSCKNKHWTKKWTKIKQKNVLTPKQRSLIIGSLLGDGTMRLGKGAINANFKVEHGLTQKGYVTWKYRILKPWVFSEPKISYRYKNGEKYRKSWWFRTIRHPLLTKIYDRFYTKEKYRNGKKIIPKNIARELNPLVLAIWIMDDGSYSNSKGTLDISTYSFSLSDLIMLEIAFKKLFDIEAKHYRDRDKGYRIYFSKGQTKKLVQIIHPYIIPSMMYKIGFAIP